MMVARILGRMVAAAFALAVAVLAACLTLALAVYHLFGLPGIPQDPSPGTLADGVFYMMFTVMAVGQFSLALPVVAIVAAEFLRIRSWIYYTVVGALSGAYALASLEGNFGGGDAATMGVREAAAFIAAGLAGGLVYWFIAGRGAGVPPRRRDRNGADRERSGEVSPG